MVGEATNQTCYSYQNMTKKQYTDYMNSLGQTFDDSSDDLNPKVTEGNIYKTLTLIIAIIYIIYLVLSLFLSCVSNMMSNQTPEDYIKIGTCKKFLACFCKILPPVLIILSWINFILFVVFWILITVGKCEYSRSDTPGKFMDEKDYFNDNKVLILVNSCFWILLHYGGAIVRGMTYVEPFMYSPEIGKPNMIKTLLFKKLGP
jgi:preprotein translocase subunit SecG